MLQLPCRGVDATVTAQWRASGLDVMLRFAQQQGELFDRFRSVS